MMSSLGVSPDVRSVAAPRSLGCGQILPMPEPSAEMSALASVGSLARTPASPQGPRLGNPRMRCLAAWPDTGRGVEMPRTAGFDTDWRPRGRGCGSDHGRNTCHVQINSHFVDSAWRARHYRRDHCYRLAGRDDSRAGHTVRDLRAHRRRAAGHAGVQQCQRGETAGTRALFILSGLVSIAFGVVLFARPGIGAVSLALLFGLFSLIYGGSLIVMGVDARRSGRTLRSVISDAA